MDEYYSDQVIRKRMNQFLGCDASDRPTCEYLTAGDEFALRDRLAQPVDRLHEFWAIGADLNRSFWDRQSLLFHLDIDYVNFDFPGEAYLNPERVFNLLKPVEVSAERILGDWGIVPLKLLSGRGPHYIWRISRASTAFRQLARLGHVRTGLATINARAHRPNGASIPEELGTAYDGLGLMMEYLAGCLKQTAAPASNLPVEVTALEVGEGSHGREMISLDISEYGDPLSTRVVRVPFSHYFKPWQQRATVGVHVTKNLPGFFSIPLSASQTASSMWPVMRDAVAVKRLARENSAEIPEANQATMRFIDAYQQSTLRAFHNWFYAEEPQPSTKLLTAWDQTSPDLLPDCARTIIEHPNDLLLRPSSIQRLTRILLSLGWHPRQVSGLVQAKFEQDHSWGDRWNSTDAGTRADFYTRLFAGLFVTCRDDLVDLNCKSTQEEHLCCGRDCHFNLQRHQKSLMNRRTYERLARRPFNRLFLPEEHL